MHYLKIAAGIAVLALSASATGQAQAAGWTEATVPPTGQNGYLLAVDAHTASDAWAVGTLNRAAGDGPGPLIDHWNGSAWSQAATPTFPAGDTVSLNSVSASSATDAWAAGFVRVGRYQFSPLTVHWNGTAWTTVSDAIGTGYPGSYLVGVADIGSTDAYAIGDNSALARGKLEQWNGTGWNVLSPPSPTDQNTQFNSISADSANDVWVVGSYLTEVNSVERYETYTLHWNGTAWSIVTMPRLSGSDTLFDYDLTSIDAISPTNVWAVGESGDNAGVGGTPSGTVTEHWNGTAWSVVPSPTTGTAPYLTGVTASSAAGVWAVGYDTPQGASGPQTLTLHWTGTTWTIVPSPNVGGSSLLTSASAAPGAGTVWAVGYSGTSGSLNPLALLNG